MNIRQMLPFFCLFISSAHADQILLDNGDRLSGKILRMQAGKLTLKAAWGEKITLPWSSVAQIELNAPARLVLQSGEYSGTVEPDGHGGMQIAADRVKINALQREDIFAINPVSYTDPDAFKRSGRIDAGLGYARGNTETDSYYFSGQMKWENRLNRVTFIGDVRNVTSAGTTTTTDKSRLATKYDRFLNERSYLYVQGIAEQNKLANIKLRTTAGIGSGYQIYRREYLNLGVEGGVSAVRTRFTNAPANTESTLRLAVNYDQYFWNKALKVENSSEAFLPLAGSDDLLLHSKTSLLVPLGNSVSAGLAVIVDWDRKPAFAKKSLDRSVQATLGYGF